MCQKSEASQSNIIIVADSHRVSNYEKATNLTLLERHVVDEVNMSGSLELRKERDKGPGLGAVEYPDSIERGPGAQEQVYFGLPEVYVPKGAHIAHFFGGEQERLDVLAPFLQAGLNAGDQCLLVTEHLAAPIIKDRLRNMEVDRSVLDSGQLFVSQGAPKVHRLASVLEGVLARAKRARRTGIRIAGDMTWTLGKMVAAADLFEYETFYDRYLGPKASFLALCQYDHTRFGGTAIMSALHTHSLSVIGNEVEENPFYRDPNEVFQ